MGRHVRDGQRGGRRRAGHVYLALRFAIGSATLAPFALAARRRGRRRDGAAGVVLGLLFFAGYALQISGLAAIAPGRAGFITGLYIPLVPAFAWALFRQHPWPTAWMGIGLAVVGMGALSLSGRLGPSTGDLLVLGGAAALALHIVLMARLAPGSDSSVLALV